MPALPAVPQVLKVTLQYKASNDLNLTNSLHWKYTGGTPDNTAMAGWAGTIATAWTTNMAPLHHSSVSLVGVTAVDLTTPTGGVGINTGIHAGTRTGTALPSGTCALVNYTIQRRYRGGKPRTYLPAGSSSDVLDGQKWTVAFTGAAQTGWNNFFAAVQGTPPTGTTILGSCGVSYYTGFIVHTGSTGRASNIPQLRTGGPLVDMYLGAFIDPEYGSQRRRNRP